MQFNIFMPMRKIVYTTISVYVSMRIHVSAYKYA